MQYMYLESKNVPYLLNFNSLLMNIETFYNHMTILISLQQHPYHTFIFQVLTAVKKAGIATCLNNIYLNQNTLP